MLKALFIGCLLFASFGCKPSNCPEIVEQHQTMVRQFESGSPSAVVEAAKLIEIIGADADKNFTSTTFVAGKIVQFRDVGKIKDATPAQLKKYAQLKSSASRALAMSKQEIEAVCH